MEAFDDRQDVAGKSVLIVDDDADTLELLELVFKRRGYRTTPATSGAQALACVEAGQPDVILLDVMMPEMDGWEAFRRVRQRCSAPVIFLTALTEGKWAARALELGVDDYVHKPFYVPELLARVERLLVRVQASSIYRLAPERMALPSVVPMHESENGNVDNSYDEQAISSQFLATIILPAYNEDMALPKVLSDLYKVIDERYEVIVIDDGSTDKTAAVARKYPCRVLQHQVNQGKGIAVRTGLQNARGTYVIVMDADATYPASSILPLVELLSENDIVRGVRHSTKESMPTLNWIGNRIFDLVLTRVGMNCSDHFSGLYGMRREELVKMDIVADGFDIEAEISIKAKKRNLRVSALPIEYQPRLGEKKLNAWKDGWKILNRIFLMVLVFNPVLTFIYPGAAVMTLAILGALFLIETPIITVYFGLGVHSFILASIGILAGFQLVIFGMAAALYSVEAGYAPKPWLIASSSRFLRFGAAGIGAVMAIAAAIQILEMIIGWLFGGAGEFNETRALVLASAVLVLGLQLLSASLFLSIFADRLRNNAKKGSLEKRNQVIELTSLHQT